MGNIKLDGHICERCEHVWVSRINGGGSEKKPLVCPKCKSPYWDIPRKEKQKSYKRKNKKNTDKKGVLKIGFFGVFLLIGISILIAILFSVFSSAIIQKTSYNLGDKVKINLINIENYKLKIITPSTSYILEGSNEIFAFRPEETGHYELILSYGGKQESYNFEVINKKENETNKVLKKDSQKEIGTDISKNIINENNINEDSLAKKGTISKETNQTLLDKTNKSGEETNNTEEKIIINKPVKWNIKENIPDGSKKIKMKIPVQAENISVYKNENSTKKKIDAEIDSNFLENTLTRIVTLNKNLGDKKITLENVDGEVEVEYITPPATAEEKIISEKKKEVVVSSPKGLHYTNVTSYTNIPEFTSDKNSIKIYWKESDSYLDFQAFDTDNNGLLDYVEWEIPHLSTQTFEIIVITKAEHLDENRKFIEDVYSEVKERDNIWKEIPRNHFIRAVFEKNLTSGNDISIYAQSNYSNSRVEVYEKDKNNLLADFGLINKDKKYRIFLNNLQNPQDTFDLKVVGNPVSFDYIVDPMCTNEYDFSANQHNISHVGSWAVKVAGWHTADDSQAVAGKNPEDTATTNMGDHDFTTDGAFFKLKLKDKNSADGQWLKIDTGMTPGQQMAGDVRIRIMGADLKSATQCAGKQTWVDFTNVITYLYMNSTAVNQSANVTEAISNVLISNGCTAATPACTVDAVELNVTDLYNQAPSGQNFTLRVIADSGFGNKQITEIVEIYLQYAIIQDIEAPNITLVDPANNSVDTDGYVTFTYNTTDNVAVSSCSLILDGSVDQTDTSITEGINQTFSKIVASGIHNWSINCTDSNSNVGSSETRIINISLPNDNEPPIVTLIAPANGTNDNDGTVLFEYNVTDNLAVASCNLIIDGSIDQTDASITESAPQNFSQSLKNGLHSWSVNCTDNSANANVGNSSTRYVNISAPVLTGRWWESSGASYTSSASINLVQARDGIENDATFSIATKSLATMSTATSGTMGNNGALIGASSNIDLSGYFTTTKNNKGFITWKAYISNSSGDTLICQAGDDYINTATKITSAGTFTNTCTAPSTATRLVASDKLKLIVNIYNDDKNTQTYGHHWDSTRLSFMDINDFKSLGFLEVNLVDPLIDPNIGINDVFNITCQARCEGGNCTNTNISAQFNPGSGFVNIGSSGNLILNSGNNPNNTGEIDNTYINYTFEIKGNAISTNTIRCVGTSDYSNVNGTTTTTVSVGGGANTPTVVLTNPANNTSQNTSNITLFYNATDVDLNIANSSLILNNIVNQTNSSAILNGQINNFTLTNLADGVYTWTVNVTDLTNLVGNTSTRTFTIDTQAPSITSYNPLANESFNVNSVLFNFTASDNIDSVLVCDLIIDSIVYENDFLAQNGTPTNFTETLGAGLHLWNITCLDDASNTGISEIRNFTITDEPPTVALITANNSFTTTGNIVLEYNASDNNGFLESRLILNGAVNLTNQTEILNKQINNFTLSSLSEGIYTWNVNVTDTGGLNATNESIRTFTVDLNNPNVTLNLPLNNTVSNSSTVDFNFTVIDTIDSSLSCTLYAGSTSDGPFSAINGSLTNRQISGLTDGGKLWNVTCLDDSGRSSFSETRLINITESPSIQLNTANNSFFNTSSFNLSYTPSDNTNLSVCDLYIDGSFNQTNSSQIINNQQNNFSISGISEGQHNWYVSCNDTISLQNQSEKRAFTVDTGGLNVSLLYPPTDLQIFSSSVEFSYNATDNIDSFLTCNITVNNFVKDTYSAQNGNITNRTVAFSQGGFKVWNVTCLDDSSNTVTSETRNFTLAFAPVVNLTTTNNTFFNSSSITLFYNTTDDNGNIANSSLILNNIVNQTNSSAILNGQINNFTLTNLADGVYTWTVNVTDLTNLVGTDDEQTFTVDTQNPLLTVNGPLQDEVVTTNNVTLNFTVTDNIDILLTCNITVDGSLEFGNINATNGTDTINYMLRNDGNFTWDVRCYDDAGNLNQSNLINFSVVAPPNVSLNSPEDNFRTNKSDITFVYTPEDAIGITQCDLYIDNYLNNTDTTINKNQQNSFSVVGMAEGAHNWTVNCTDADSNTNQAPLRYFYIDRTPPTIQLNAPSNTSNIDFNQGYVTFNWTTTDSLDINNLTCNLTIDSVVNQTNISVTSGISYTMRVNNFALGQHLWSTTCWDSIINNTNTSEIWNFNVTLADLMVNVTSIEFNNTNPTENETIMINATIWNLINVTTTNITVQFYDGNPDSGGAQIGQNQTINTLSPLSQEIVSVNWNTDIGTSDIFVVVDPPLASNGSIEEWDENNNKANKSITTGAWHFVVGDIKSETEFELASSSSNKSIIRWPSVNFDSGNLYVADSESAISWIDLAAIGKNTPKGNTSNDFSEIDSLLNMTGFKDSVTNIYLNDSGSIMNTTSFIVFNSLIQGVPIANSTNNTNFITGILWDSSDDLSSDHEFSIGDKEDLIFASKINKGKQGAYGIYDYEIRIPAKLREYYTTETKEVIFYTEIR